MAKRKKKRVSAAAIERRLINSIKRWPAIRGRETRADSFEDCGVLTMNKGVVIELGTGQRFQITIVEF